MMLLLLLDLLCMHVGVMLLLLLLLVAVVVVRPVAGLARPPMPPTQAILPWHAFITVPWVWARSLPPWAKSSLLPIRSIVQVWPVRVCCTWQILPCTQQQEGKVSAALRKLLSATLHAALK